MEVVKLNDDIKAMNSEISAMQESRKSNNVTIKALESLLYQCNKEIEIYKSTSPSQNSEDYNETLEFAKEELKKLEILQSAHKWYDEAYGKLSAFSGIEAIDHEKNIFRFLGKYQAEISNDSAKFLNCDLFIGDLKLSVCNVGEIISQILERLSAMEDMQKCANQLGWGFALSKSEPFCILAQDDSSPPAIVALIGDKVHPLVEWGDVPVFDFNKDKGTMEMKFRKYWRLH